MGRPHRYTRRDANQQEIMDALRDVPWLLVYDISTVPDSQCPGDILVSHFGEGGYCWQPFEIKREGARLSDMQKAHHESGYVPIVHCAEDVLERMGLLDG